MACGLLSGRYWHWDIGGPMARMVISPPQGQPQQPDHPNWSWHEYGMRVGFWRLRRIFERFGINPTVTLNARVCETYPAVVEACLESGWELNAHSYDQRPMHKVEDEAETIKRSMDIITAFSGKRPRGWFGPGLTQTFDTVDLLAQEGIEYIGDWAVDDEPVTLRTKTKEIVALPYNFELHDIVMMALQNHRSQEFHTRAMDAFDCLYEESVDRPKIMSVAHHPYLSGAAHRSRHVERLWSELLARPGVVCWNGEQILDWYRAETLSSQTVNSVPISGA
jgi:allantoinase